MASEHEPTLDEAIERLVVQARYTTRSTLEARAAIIDRDAKIRAELREYVTAHDYWESRAKKAEAERDAAIAERDYRESLVREEAYARGRADALEGINGTRLS